MKKQQNKNIETVVELVDINKIQTADYNPRKFSSKKLEELKNSIKKYGFRGSLIVNKRTGNIISGNQRYKALIALGYSKVPVDYMDVDDETEKELNIVFNFIDFGFDDEKLRVIVNQIKDRESAKLILGDLIEEAKKAMEVSMVNPEFQIVRELDESYNFVVVVFENITDFVNFQTKNNLKPVIDPIKKNKKLGVGRVVKYKDILL